ncbi:MAG: histidine phosphatase family protein [Pseudomonadota bacterium]
MPGLCYGRLDLDVAPCAKSEIAAAIKSAKPCTKIVSSPAKRAMALAKPLADALNVEITEDERLWEMDMGAWEGQLWNEIDRKESDPWSLDPMRLAPPGGETFNQVIERVSKAVDDAGEEATIVAHAGPIRAVMMMRRGISFDEAFATKIPFAQPLHIPARAV